MNLDILSQKDEKWRAFAFNLSKDKMLSDDLVNDMYLKLYKLEKEINDFYVIATIRNLYFDYLKQENKKVSLELLSEITTDAPFEADDREKQVIDNVYWVARDYMLMLSDKKSLRQIGKELNTNYGFIYRTIKEEKNKWEDLKK